MTQKEMSKILFYRADWNSNASRQADDGYGGVGYYRTVQPAKYVKGHEVTVVGAKLHKKGETAEQQWTRIFKNYDIFWTTYFSDAQVASQIFYHRDKFKKKVIVDLDDNYLDVPSSNPLYDRFKETKKDKAFLSTILTFADAITVSTELSRTMAVVEAAREWSKALENQNDIAALDNAENALIRAVDALKEG